MVREGCDSTLRCTGRETLCSLEWMDLLGDLFKSNRNNTIIGDAASYQYFASVNGSMVYYPGESRTHREKVGHEMIICRYPNLGNFH